VQAEASDRDLVAVLELVPVDTVTVDEDAVQAAIVEYPTLVAVPMDERVAAGDRRVVKSDVGRQAAPDARPALRKRQDTNLVLLPSQVDALPVE